MRRKETPDPIWIKFHRIIGIPEVNTFANFGVDRLRGFRAAMDQILPFPIDSDQRPQSLQHSGTTARVCDFWHKNLTQRNPAYVSLYF